MDSIARADAFLAQLRRSTVRQRARLVARMPLADVQHAALHHPDPEARFWALFFLDHYANDASMGVFAEGLRDRSVQVRGMALHSIACETCKSEALCVTDVVAGLVGVLADDPAAELRLKTVPLLMRFAVDDARARDALERAATKDPDAVVRRVAHEALSGRVVVPRKRYQRAQRRHAKYHARRG